MPSVPLFCSCRAAARKTTSASRAFSDAAPHQAKARWICTENLWKKVLVEVVGGPLLQGTPFLENTQGPSCLQRGVGNPVVEKTPARGVVNMFIANTQSGEKSSSNSGQAPAFVACPDTAFQGALVRRAEVEQTMGKFSCGTLGWQEPPLHEDLSPLVSAESVLKPTPVSLQGNWAKHFRSTGRRTRPRRRRKNLRNVDKRQLCAEEPLIIFQGGALADRQAKWVKQTAKPERDEEGDMANLPLSQPPLRQCGCLGWSRGPSEGLARD